MDGAVAKEEPLSAARAEQPLELAEVYRAHVQTVARWAARLGGPSLDVEDVVQEVFINVHRALPRFRGESSLTTWLYRITANAVARKRRRERWTSWLGGSAADVAGGIASPERSVLENLEQRQATAQVYAVLERMSEKYRTVLILFELEGMSGEQIAELTGTRVGTVWVHLHRARAQFLQHFEAVNQGESQ